MIRTPHPALSRTAIALIRPPARLRRSPHAQPVGFLAELVPPRKKDSALLRRVIAFIRRPPAPWGLSGALPVCGYESPDNRAYTDKTNFEFGLANEEASSGI